MVGSQISLWSEFLLPEQILKFSWILERENASLFMALRRKDLERKTFTSCLKELCEKVDVRLWLLLSKEEGYWPNASNATRWVSFAEEIIDWVDKNSLRVKWIIADMEPAIIASPLRISDRKNFTSGKMEMKKFVDHAHEKGFKVMVTTLQFILDSRNFEYYLGLPISGIEWDEVSFMVYRTLLRDTWKVGRYGSYLVYSYASTAHSIYGEKACIDIGIVGNVGVIGIERGYRKVKELHEDIGAVLRAGVEKIHIYSLDGMVRTGWIHNPSIFRAGMKEVKVDIYTLLLRSICKMLGRILLASPKIAEKGFYQR